VVDFDSIVAVRRIRKAWEPGFAHVGLLGASCRLPPVDSAVPKYNTTQPYAGIASQYDLGNVPYRGCHNRHDDSG
jgi:hypothetical protein